MSETLELGRSLQSQQSRTQGLPLRDTTRAADRPLRASLLLACLLLLGGCVSVPFDYPKTASSVQPPVPGSVLQRMDSQWSELHGEKSGFIGLGNGIEALGARLRMMEEAQSSIDAQYFILKKDRAGALFTGKMLRAADRGVKVRFLIDDIFTPDADEALTLLDSHPNIEVRLFNPVSRQAYKYWSYLVDFKRANRRMHNKSFTVDNAASIVGGRNIGEEYFELKQDVKFDDYEVFAIGPVVREVSDGFDQFWNSELSVPIAAFELEVDPALLDEWRDYIDREITGSSGSIYAQAINSRLLRDIREGVVEPVVAEATMITDSPEKLQQAVGQPGEATLAEEVGRRFLAAGDEIIIVTPYFIPKKSGSEVIERILDQGVRVVVVTNSLASTNHIPVHSGYMKYRKRLLKAGAEFYEIRADRPGEENEWGLKPELITLHSKATVVDRQTIFVGSLNFDPRSILINTEMGLFIESADAGGRFSDTIVESLPETTYRVTLDERGKLQWTYDDGELREVLDKEPLASWGRRTMVQLYRVLPIESQL